MGLQVLLGRLLGMLPGPIVIGSIYDSTCLVWKYDECGVKTSCAEYELESLAQNTKYVVLIGNCKSSIINLVKVVL